MKKLAFIFITAFMIMLFSCSNNLMPEIDNGISDIYTEDQEVINEPQILLDAESNRVLFVESNGEETIVRTDEDSGEVFCVEVSDYHIFDNSEQYSRTASGSQNQCRAIVLGKRSDGSPGLWLVMTGGKVIYVENDEGSGTSELLGIVEGERSLSRLLGWTYDAVDLAVNGDEIIIVGTALNEEGISWRRYTFGAGTQLGVYWVVSIKSDSLYRISRARVIGTKEKYVSGNEGFFKRQTGLTWLFHLFFKDWYYEYLKSSESVAYDENEQVFVVSGIDQEDERAAAKLIPGKILSFEKVLTGNLPPSASFESGDFRVSGAGTSSVNGIYEEAGLLNGSSYYTQVNGSNRIFVNVYTGTAPFPAGTYWAFDENESETSFFNLDYVMLDVGVTEKWLPENGTWYAVAGSNPVMDISGIPFNVGSDNGDDVGETISVSYLYNDPDGDAEGNTEIRWFRCDTADSLITDANSVEVSSGSLSYTVQTDDMNKFLKVQIVPVDDQGNRGESVVSKAYKRLDKSS